MPKGSNRCNERKEVKYLLSVHKLSLPRYCFSEFFFNCSIFWYEYHIERTLLPKNSNRCKQSKEVHYLPSVDYLLLPRYLFSEIFSIALSFGMKIILRGP